MTLNEYQNYHETKKHTDDRFLYNTYLCAIPDNFTFIPLHWHNEIEMIVIKKGAGIINVNLRTFPVQKGDIITILPGQLHSISYDGTNRMEYENILFKKEFLVNPAGNRQAYDDFLAPLFQGIRSVPPLLNKNSDVYRDVSLCIEKIDALSDKRPDGYQIAIQGLMLEIFFYLIHCTPGKMAPPVLSSKSMEKLRLILKHVEEHYNEPLSIEQMAALSYYSKSYFMKFFKQSMGLGFTEYLNDYRLTMAARLLQSEDRTVTEAAGECGFDNLSHFHRLFKRKYHVTPHQYKKQTPASYS